MITFKELSDVWLKEQLELINRVPENDPVTRLRYIWETAIRLSPFFRFMDTDADLRAAVEIHSILLARYRKMAFTEDEDK